MDAKAARALGAALAALRDDLNERIDALDVNPTYEVPVPSVTVEGSQIDIQPLSEALMGLADVLTADRKEATDTNKALAEALDAMSKSVFAMNDRVNSIEAQMNASLQQMTQAMLAPKSLVFDDDGEPVGLVVGDRRSLN